ncbi:MAG: c-type cytochrome, partial [Longimicrobiales bacterium]
MTNFTKTFASALIAALPFLLSSGSLGAQDRGPLSLTPEVNAAGEAAYERSCASCHLPTFQGSFEAPALAGPNFRAVWTERTINEFRATIRTMPPTAPNSLRDAEYDAITVYLLGANGVERDGRVVQADREATVGSMLTGAATATAGRGAGGGGGRGAGAGGRGGRGGAVERTEPEGRTQTFHEITDFEPVTEQELLNPDPRDWLIYRRTYDSQGYSPLDQVNRNNVDDLGLEWVWAMADGTNQPTPLVHDGIMYLASPMNVIQALDATDGTLLWEYTRLFADDFRIGFSQLRNLAIWGENIYVATK